MQKLYKAEVNRKNARKNTTENLQENRVKKALASFRTLH